ncbi:MAG: L,D-transpeptidase family protein [Hyphomicrobiales bacterium]|nr:L,D-transpeptidase family protein [Hyphomicrobiales bacterium]
MDIHVSPDGTLSWQDHRFRCALGRSGVSAHKREGDGATPAGAFVLRELFFRADRLPPPETGLAVQAIEPEAGWCDDAQDPGYNRLVRLPYSGRHERLWRDDHLYDVLVVIGHNDDPVIPGCGSAIFLHVAGADYPPTEGCVALALDDLLYVMRDVQPGDRIVIQS